MPSVLSPIVGAHFRPPARVVISHLPINTPLILSPEPTNPYDSSAIKVLISEPVFMEAAAWKDHESELLECGFTAQALIAKVVEDGELHLGYIPSSTNIKALSAGQYWPNGSLRGASVKSNVEILLILAGAPDHISTFTLSPTGTPLIKLEWE